MYGFAVQAVNKDQTLGSLIYRQPMQSVDQVNALKKQLIEEDRKVERQSFYFPHVQQALKLEDIFQRALASLKGLFLDLAALPWRNYDAYKTDLKPQLPIYQYLKSHQVPQKYLDEDRFQLIFYSGEKAATPIITGSGLLGLMAREGNIPLSNFEGKNYQEYATHYFDVYEGVSLNSGGGWGLLTDEYRSTLSRSFIAS